MTNILCYGDSNTWGVDMSIKNSQKRLGADKRWTGVLKRELGPDYVIFEEGLRGRTTAFDNPLEYGRNGTEFLDGAFLTHDPVDIFIVMLGTNDMKDIMNVSAEDSAWGLEQLILRIKSILHVSYTKKLKILVISPILQERSEDGVFYYGFSEKSIEKTRGLAAAYQAVADKYDCAYLDAAQYAGPSAFDGIHLKNEDHIKLGKAIAEKIRSL